MKQLLLQTLFMLNAAFLVGQTCLPGGIIFTLQSQIDDFASNYPACAEISGGVLIHGPNITSLAGLSQITSIGEYLIIQETVLTDLSGLDNVASIGGFLYITRNASLANLNGLNNVTSIGGYLDIFFSASLASITALGNVTSIGGHVKIAHTEVLPTLNGLENVATIAGSLIIYDNLLLTSLMGIQNIDPATIQAPLFSIDLDIHSNPLLSECEVQSICDLLALPDKVINIHDNASGCDSQTEIETACFGCPPGGITITTQAQIDNFASNYPGCTHISGDVSIQNGSDITNLDGLSQLTSISGGLSIQHNPVLLNLIGLDNVMNIGGDLLIFGNVSLQNLNGLNSITSLQMRLLIGANDDLTSLNGLEGLISVGLDLKLSFNSSLNSLGALQNLTSIGRDLYINDNPVLTSLVGLENLTSISGNLFVQNNTALTTFNAFQNLTDLQGSLSIIDNNTLSNLNGLQNLTVVGGNLSVTNNDGLTSLSGLHFITNVGGGLIIGRNDALSDLNHLANLTTLGGYFWVKENAILTSLSGIQNIDPATIASPFSSLNDLEIYGNPQLSECAVQSICGLLALPGTTTNIYDNAPGCASQTEIETACFGCPPGGITITTQAQIDNFAIDYPGCSTIWGDLIIQGGANITNLLGLAQITAIEGSLNLYYNTALPSLSGLSSITSIQEHLQITGNDALINLIGLEGLTSVDLDLKLSFNSSLNSLNGLQNLTSIGHSLSISNNSVLTSLNGLENLSILTGALIILNNNNLTSLNALGNLIAIGGELALSHNDGLTSLVGLNNISTLGGGLFLSENDALLDLNLLENLTAIGGPIFVKYNAVLNSLSGIQNIAPGTIASPSGSINDLEIQGNPQLSECAIQSICDLLALPGTTTDIQYNAPGCGSQTEIETACVSCPSGGITITTQAQIDNFANNYPGCTEISGDVHIFNGSDITNLDGLLQLTSISGGLSVQSNPLLLNIVGLDNVTNIGGDLLIFGNASLQNLNGLNSITSLQERLLIGANDDLTSLNGLEGLISVGLDVKLSFNSSLNNLGALQNLTSIGRDLDINDNPVLTSLSGLHYITSVGGGLFIRENDALLNLNHLTNLTTIGGYLMVNDNAILTSLSGIQNIDPTTIPGAPGSINDLEIHGNPQLSECEVQSICGFLLLPGITAAIYGNAPGCNSQTEIETACFSCLPDGITITTQSQIDNFVTDYPGCSTISGDLIIQGGANITNLLGLAQITTIEGGLGLYNNTALVNLSGLDNLTTVGATLELSGTVLLTDLSGLDNLTSVGAELEIKHSTALLNLNGLNNLISVGDYLRLYNNAAVNNLSGLDNLATIGGDLQIWTNNVLPSLDGLNNLTSIGGDINIEGNRTLNDLSALLNLTSIPGGIYFKNNAALSSLSGLDNIAAIGDYLLVESNPALTNLSGLDNVSSIGGYVWLYNNSSLSSLIGLDNVTAIGGYLMVYANPSLISLSSLANLNTIEGYLGVFDNPILSSLSGLNSLNAIGGDLSVYNNAVLPNLNGLENLTAINGFVLIANNTSLTSLEGIQNIDPTTIQTMVNYLEDLEIYGNPQLSECAAQSVCELLTLPGTTTNIHDNALGCDTRDEIEMACNPLMVFCQNLNIDANLDCQGIATAADFDSGYTGASPLIFSVNPEGPYPLGLTNVILTVTDYNMNTASCAATIIVEDHLRPALNCPADLELVTDPGSCETTFTVPAPQVYENCGIPVLRYRFRPVNDAGMNLPGTSWSSWMTAIELTLELGRWKVQWQAKDAANNQRKCAFKVNIVDHEPPVLNCLNPIVEFNGESEIILTGPELWDELASFDNCGETLFNTNATAVVTCDQIGMVIPFIISAEDVAGNMSTCLANITVGGLPCDWSTSPDGVNCPDGNEADFIPEMEIFTINSAGCYDPDFYSVNESNGYVGTELCGDGEIIAQISSVNGDGWAGVAMRENLNAGAKMFQLSIDGLFLTKRETRQSNGTPAFTQLFPTQEMNWLRLTRTGNQFAAYHSMDGYNWVTVIITGISMPSCINVGLFTENANPSGSMTAEFGHVGIISGVPAILSELIPADLLERNTNLQHQLSIYPNPSNGEVVLDFGNIPGNKGQVRVFNYAGKLLEMAEFEDIQYSKQQLNLQPYPDGLYLINIQVEGMSAVNKRLFLKRE